MQIYIDVPQQIEVWRIWISSRGWILLQGTLHFNTQILSTFHNYDGVFSRCNSQMFTTPGEVHLSLITQNAVFKIKKTLQFGDYLDRQNKKVTSFRDRWRVFILWFKSLQRKLQQELGRSQESKWQKDYYWLKFRRGGEQNMLNQTVLKQFMSLLVFLMYTLTSRPHYRRGYLTMHANRPNWAGLCLIKSKNTGKLKRIQNFFFLSQW